jgi:putative two-component system response regulator
VLLKPGKLDAQEWEIMKKHSKIGGDLLMGSSSEYINFAEIIARGHHEKWDGSGYPDGLKGNKIPIAVRCCSIADVFDALTSRRPYKEPFSVEEALKIISDGRGSHFDPAVVDAFFAIQEEIMAIRNEYADGSQLAV